jgi:hypothetical protein
VARAAAGAAAAATAGAAPGLVPASAEEEEKWRAAVGPKADLYLERWGQMAEKKTNVSWNWAACLANLFWFAYRTMWVPVAVMAVVYLINIAVMGNPQAARLMFLVIIAISFVTGSFGTHLYRQQTAKLVASTAGQDKAGALETLRQRGGVSMPALYGAIGGVVVLVLIAGVVIAGQTQTQLNTFPDTFNTVTTDNGFGTTGDKPPPTPDDQLPPEEPPPEEPPPEY